MAARRRDTPPGGGDLPGCTASCKAPSPLTPSPRPMSSRLRALLAYLRTLPRHTREELLGPVQLGLLGYLAWLFGSGVLLWHAWQSPASNVIAVLALCLASGIICLTLGIYLLVGFLLPPARWHRDDRDWRLWTGLVAGSACAFAIPHWHALNELEYFFHSFFLLNYVPLLARFRFHTALGILITEALLIGLLSGGIFGLGDVGRSGAGGVGADVDGDRDVGADLRRDRPGASGSDRREDHPRPRGAGGRPA